MKPISKKQTRCADNRIAYYVGTEYLGRLEQRHTGVGDGGIVLIGDAAVIATDWPLMHRQLEGKLSPDIRTSRSYTQRSVVEEAILRRPSTHSLLSWDSIDDGLLALATSQERH